MQGSYSDALGARRLVATSIIGIGLIAIAAAALIACVPKQSASPTPGSATDAPNALPANPTEQELLEARRFRRAFGLREDDAWITTVAADPDSQVGDEMFGVPLMPFEYQDLLRRTANAESAGPIVASYGAANPETWAGMFIDQEAGGELVAQFTDNVQTHERRLVRLLPPGSIVEVRRVEWTLVQLREFAEQVKDQSDWFGSIGAELYSADIDEINNGISVRFRSGDAADTSLVARHFGEPVWLLLKWMPSAWTGPTGDLVILVVDRAGRPMEHMSCKIAPVDVDLPESAAAYSTRPDGRCVLRGIPAVTYQVDIGAPTGDDDTIVATDRVTVAPDDATDIRLVARSP
jgi:hypothetical protein